MGWWLVQWRTYFVGSVSVGVVPDARKFNDEIRKQLFPDADNIGREYGAKIGRGLQESIRVYIEKTKEELKQGFKANVEADTTKAKEEIRVAREEAEARSWHVRLHVDPGSLREIGQTIKARLKDSIGNLAVGGALGGGLATGASGLLAAVGPLGALTVGIGSFAALAVPELTKVETAMKKVGTARKTAMSQLSPQERQLVPAIQGIKDAFHGVVKELAPVVDEVIKLGAGLIKNLLPTLALFAHVGASILMNFIRPFGEWVRSNSFQRLASQFAIFGDAAGRILGPQIVRLLQVFSRLFLLLLPSGLTVLRQLLPLIVQLIVGLTPGIVVLAKIAAAVLKWVNTNHLLVPTIIAVAAAILVLTGPTGMAGIIAATIAVALVVGIFAKHWRAWWEDIKHWAQVAWSFLTHGWGQLLIPGLTLIRVVIEVVRNHWRQAWTDIRDWAHAVWNFLIHGIGQVLVPQVKAIWTIIALVANHWRDAWNQIKGAASSVWNFLLNNVIHPLIRIVGNDLPGAFRTAVGVISRVWNTLKSIFSGPVKFLVNTVYDNGIARLWNDVMNKIGGPTLPVIPHFASGGRVPGWGGGDIQPALLEPGETVVSKEHSRWMAPMFRAAGVPGYQGGGIIGGIGHAISGLFHGAGDVAKIILALTTGNATAAENAFSDLFHTSAAGDLAKMMLGIPRTLVDTAVKFVISKIPSLLGGAGGTGGPASGAVRALQLYAASLFPLYGWDTGQLGSLIALWNGESGWNPEARNLTSGAFGIPQALPPGKMGALAASGNAAAQIRWGEGYIHDTYGTPANAYGMWLSRSPHWYDDGGWWPNGTFGVNTSGHAEYVLTHDDMKNGGFGGEQHSYHMHFDGMSYRAFSTEVGHAMRVVDLHRGLAQRSGRRV